MKLPGDIITVLILWFIIIVLLTIWDNLWKEKKWMIYAGVFILGNVTGIILISLLAINKEE